MITLLVQHGVEQAGDALFGHSAGGVVFVFSHRPATTESDGSWSSAHCPASVLEQCTCSRAYRQMRQAARTMNAACLASSVRDCQVPSDLVEGFPPAGGSAVSGGRAADPGWLVSSRMIRPGVIKVWERVATANAYFRKITCRWVSHALRRRPTALPVLVG